MSEQNVQVPEKGLGKVLFASSAGTIIEWYDFYIFGALSAVIATQFFPKDNPTAAYLSTLATFATGFIVRPFGALVFGRLGDIAGRKFTFLFTLLLMGLSTFAVGLLPTYEQAGVLSPILLTLLRLLQGLALGGEYGGAATYVAEHAPAGQRGKYTSYIQTTATLGLLMSLGVIGIVRSNLEKGAFETWGWRVPFWISLLLVIISYGIRKGMSESPLFAKVKAEGQTSTNPLRESFVNPENRRWVLIALFGATAGQGVVWYTGQFYALAFMQKTLNIAPAIADRIMMIALILATPLFIVFGSLSDKIGRKKLMLGGCLLAAMAYVPIYSAMADVVGYAGQKGFIAGDFNQVAMIALVFIQVVFVTMVYGPIAAFLVELFPTKIRYTSMSLPYHIGNGVFGGLVPFISTAITVRTGSFISGLWYPIGVATLTFLIGSIFLTDDRSIAD